MSTPTPSRVVISPVTPEDYEALADAHVRAFQFTNLMNSFYPPSIQPPLEVKAALFVREHIKRASEPPFDIVQVKATLDGRVVGSAVWRTPIDRTSTGGDPLPRELEIKELLAAREREAWEDQHDAIPDLAFRGKLGAELTRMRKDRFRGKPHWYLSPIFVHPDFQGRGIGAALLAYGTDQADAAGLPTWLEASPHGQRVYSKLGFEVVEWCEIPGEQFEGGSIRFPAMERKSVAARV